MLGDVPVGATRSMPAGHGGAEGRGEYQGNAAPPHPLAARPQHSLAGPTPDPGVPMTRQNGCLFPGAPHDLAP